MLFASRTLHCFDVDLLFVCVRVHFNASGSSRTAMKKVEKPLGGSAPLTLQTGCCQCCAVSYRQTYRIPGWDEFDMAGAEEVVVKEVGTDVVVDTVA